MNNPYEDIINLPHHVSSTRPQMPMSDRAAQFSPFAALVGYDAAIKETARPTDKKIELGEESLNELNTRLCFLAEHLDEEPELTLSYFVADEHKSGGSYIDISGTVKGIDSFKRTLTMRSGEKIPLDDICSIQIKNYFESL